MNPTAEMHTDFVAAQASLLNPKATAKADTVPSRWRVAIASSRKSRPDSATPSSITPTPPTGNTGRGYPARTHVPREGGSWTTMV